jgi:hypothetical protein
VPALPCVALSTWFLRRMDGSEAVRPAILAAARALLVQRSRGAGVLGFAPEEIRLARLEAVRQIEPALRRHRGR